MTKITYYRVNKTKAQVYLDPPLPTTDGGKAAAAAKILVENGVTGTFNIVRIVTHINGRMMLEITF